jgi:hypothetical protein
MTNEEYFETLLSITGLPFTDMVRGRQLNITVERDPCGKPSSAIIAFDGCPPMYEVYVSLAVEVGPVVIRGRTFQAGKHSWTYRRLETLHLFLNEFVNSRKDDWNQTVS